jgi:hypothetical protein
LSAAGCQLSGFPSIYLIKADAMSYFGLSAKTTDNRQLTTDNSAAGAPATVKANTAGESGVWSGLIEVRLISN